MSLLSLIFGRILPGFILVLAIIVGWFSSHEEPLGVFFATVTPLSKGKLPATIVGHGKMEGVPSVPDDMKPLPRPTKELFLDLPNGRMPQNGLGMCCRWSAYDNRLVYRTVLWYLLQGGRHIDGADLYLNHEPIGEAIAEAMKRGIPRSEIFVTTKIFPTSFGIDAVREKVPRYLKELNLEYIDLILLHFPAPFPYITTNDCQKRRLSPTKCRQETFSTLAEFVKTGQVRNIGVSNFAVSHLQELEGIHPVANNQIQYSPFVDASVQETFAYCAQHNITITAYSPLGGFMDKDKALAYQGLQDMANKYQRTVSQIMLRWAMQCGAAVIPGTSNPQHMVENLDIYNFELEASDMAALDALKHTEDAKKFFTMDVRQIE